MTSLQRKLPEWMSVKQQEDRIDDAKKSFCKKNILEDNLPFMKFNGSIVYSYESNDCSLLSEDIRSSLLEEDVLGFDIEWPPVYTKGKTGKVALIQVCVSEKKCYLFHISPMAGFPKGLKRLLEDESVRKVGVGIEGDQWKLMSDYELKLKGFIELSEMANQKLRCKEKWSLNGLIKHLFKEQLIKESSVRCSNWDIFPLTEDQKLYAATDAYAGLLIYKKLEGMDAHESDSFRVGREGVADCKGVKRQLTDLSKGLMDLVNQVPNSFGCYTEAVRAVDILEDLSEKLEELRNIMKEASKAEGNGLHFQNSEDCSKKDKSILHVACKESLAEHKMDCKNADSQNNKDIDSCQNENRDEDFFMTLGISEEELYMMEREDDKKQTNPDYKLNKDSCDTNEEKDMSYVIESDEDFDSEIIKSLEDLDNSTEEALGTGVPQAGLIPAKSVDTVADEEEDEGIEEEDDDDDWDPSMPEPSAQHISCLKTYFGHSSFKPVQWKVVHSVLRERRDNLVVMATGYGKSLCYQFAPVYTSGIGIVICPLISLMEDQVLQLEMSNISSCFLGSAQSKNVLQDVKDGKMRVIYMTPEFCSRGISLLQDLDNRYGITLIAIDEAHCISEWGHDFRSAYRSLGSLKRMLPNVPIVALTATASPSIREDITKSLNLHNPQVTCTSFDRPNLYLDVARKTTNISIDLRQFLIKKQQGSGWEFEGATIVYCPTRKTSEQVTAELIKLGIACGTYHAGMGIKQRREVHHRFMRDEIQCVVATVAFGMGINKPDIRKVIHYGAPKEMESYYQEIGRAGRDGLPSCCHALWTQADMNFNRHMLGEIPNKGFREYKLKMLTKMEKYLNSSTCRRKIILSHFEDKQLRKASSGIMGTEKCCDNCKTRLICNISINDTEDNLQDFGPQAYKFISAVDVLGQKFGTGVPVLFLRGSTSQRVPDRFRNHSLFSSGKDQTEAFWKVLARQLITEGYLQESSGQTKFSTICGLTSKGSNWLIKANNEQCPSLLLPSNNELCLQRTRVSNFSSAQAHSSMVPHASSNTRSSMPKAGPEKMELKDKFSYQEAERLSKAAGVSKSSFKLQTPCKLSRPPEPEVSPREMELQTTLYGRLVVARQKIASERDIPPAVLATNKVLVDMAKLRPTTSENMKKLDGVSEAKSAMLAPLLEVVKEFCIANSLKVDVFSGSVSQSESTFFTPREQERISLPESQRMSYSLFQEQNLSLKKIADVRCLSMAVVGMHLWQALKAGYSFDVQRAGLTPEMKKLITDAIKKPPINSDLSSFKAIREYVPANIDGYLIRMVISLLEKEGSSGAQGQPEFPTQKTLIQTEENPKNVSVQNTKHKVTMGKSMWIEKKPTQPATAELEVTKGKALAPIMLASWNEASLDADTEELFSESQSSTTTPKRKLPEWFGSTKGNAATNAFKKAKPGKKKGLFD
uniref:Bifunctional 3'-5' exonuclease/ATP-dependent helicase WRN n=1 Tax=Xenopus laevis TaxID=8355 RepID=Q6GPM6_XENLA|nr:FFA-1 protein [Xenopus laevis]